MSFEEEFLPHLLSRLFSGAFETAAVFVLWRIGGFNGGLLSLFGGGFGKFALFSIGDLSLSSESLPPNLLRSKSWAFTCLIANFLFLYSSVIYLYFLGLLLRSLTSSIFSFRSFTFFLYFDFDLEMDLDLDLLLYFSFFFSRLRSLDLLLFFLCLSLSLSLSFYLPLSLSLFFFFLSLTDK